MNINFSPEAPFKSIANFVDNHHLVADQEAKNSFINRICNFFSQKVLNGENLTLAQGEVFRLTKVDLPSISSLLNHDLNKRDQLIVNVQKVTKQHFLFPNKSDQVVQLEWNLIDDEKILRKGWIPLRLLKSKNENEVINLLKGKEPTCNEIIFKVDMHSSKAFDDLMDAFNGKYPEFYSQAQENDFMDLYFMAKVIHFEKLVKVMDGLLHNQISPSTAKISNLAIHFFTSSRPISVDDPFVRNHNALEYFLRYTLKKTEKEISFMLRLFDSCYSVESLKNFKESNQVDYEDAVIVSSFIEQSIDHSVSMYSEAFRETYSIKKGGVGTKKKIEYIPRVTVLLGQP